MVWAERDLKDLPVCPFYSSHRREFIRDKKNTQLLIMSDGFSFQLRACHLASNPEKADREKHHGFGMGRTIHQNSSKRSEMLHFPFMWGKKKMKWEKSSSEQRDPAGEKGCCVFPPVPGTDKSGSWWLKEQLKIPQVVWIWESCALTAISKLHIQFHWH